MLFTKNKKEDSTLVADEEVAYGEVLSRIAAQGPIFSDNDEEVEVEDDADND